MTAKSAIRELTGIRPESVGEVIDSVTEPMLIKNLVQNWPAVIAGKQSLRSAADYIQEHYNGNPLTAFTGSPLAKGRVGYNEDLSEFSFDRVSTTLDGVLDPIFAHLDDADAPMHYVGSTLLDRWFPGFRDENDLEMGDRALLASIWLGNRVRVSAHFDVADNIACCVVGRRRFTLFPPDQIDNLYIGPWDNTPAGQPISLVDFSNPDFDKFPRFREALSSAVTVTLEAGDALCIPSMWWHHVEGLDGFNVLVNYWWRTTPSYMGSPLNVLKHALLGLRDLPQEQRQAWKHIFDLYVFEHNEDTLAHIPVQSRGILGALDDTAARQLRADLLSQLNR